MLYTFIYIAVYVCTKRHSETTINVSNAGFFYGKSLDAQEGYIDNKNVFEKFFDNVIDEEFGVLVHIAKSACDEYF